jgi:hypothetical protein
MENLFDGECEVVRGAGYEEGAFGLGKEIWKYADGGRDDDRSAGGGFERKAGTSFIGAGDQDDTTLTIDRGDLFLVGKPPGE